MKDLDNTPIDWNTSVARRWLINSPPSTRDLTFKSYITAGLLPASAVGPRTPHGRVVPPDLLKWVEMNRDASDRRNLILYGGPGTGKTSLGVCAIREFAEAGVGSTFGWNMVTAPSWRAAVASGEEQGEPSPVWFERWSHLVALHRRGERWDEEGWFEQLEEYVTVLMLDDVGTETGTPFRETLFFRHIEWSEDRGDRALVITLNDPPALWPKVFGPRAADRLAEQRRFLTVCVPGGSLR